VRAITAGQSRALQNQDRATQMRVQVSADGGTTFVDLSRLKGLDWVDSVSYGGGIDMPIVTAGIEIRRQSYNHSFATLLDSSAFNRTFGTLLDVNNQIFVEIAVVGHDQARPGESEWVEIFRGNIDDVDWSGPTVKVKARDGGNVLVDTFIETQRLYGSGAGVTIEAVIRGILDDNINIPEVGGFSVANPLELYSVNGTGAPAFNPADSPGFLILEYIQSKESVHAAIRRLALMIGFDAKYLFHTITDQFQLVWRSPVRPIPAQGKLTLTGQPIAAETFTINLTAMTAVAGAPATSSEFQIGATKEDTAQNIADALNNSPEAANIFADKIEDASVVLIEWFLPGTAGNSIVFTEAMTNTTADGGGTLGGTKTGAIGNEIPDFTFDQDDYASIGRLSISKQNIRNVQRVTFQDPADLNSRITVVRSDAASVLKYGRRFMEITEDSNSQIDTVEEAANFANIALRDLSEPDVQQSVDMRYFWPVEDFDLYRFKANDQHYDTDQDLAVVKFSHKLSKDSARSSIETRGKPSGGIERWLSIEGDNIRNAAQDLRSDNAADNMSLSPGIGGIIVTYDDPRTMSPPIPDWATTKCHVIDDDDVGFPDFAPTDANLVAVGRQTRFEIANLQPGKQHAAKVVIVDLLGNESVVSTFLQIATERVGSFHENNEREFGTVNPNPSFGIFTKSPKDPPPGSDTIPPDFWFVSVGTWGVADTNWFFSATKSCSGDVALVWNGAATGAFAQFIFTSEPWIAEEDVIYSAQFTWSHDGDDGNKTAWSARVEFFDKDKVSLGAAGTIRDTLGAYGDTPIAITPANTPFVDRGWITSPVGARYAAVVIRSTVPVSASGQTKIPTIFFDHFNIARALAKLDAFGATDRVIAANTFLAPFLSSTPNIDTADKFTPGLAAGPIEHKYTIPFTKEYSIVGKIALTDLTSGKALVARLLNNGSPLVVGSPHVGQGTTFSTPEAYAVTGVIVLAKGDIITLEGKHNDTVSRTLDDSECFLRITQTSDQG